MTPTSWARDWRGALAGVTLALALGALALGAVTGCGDITGAASPDVVQTTVLNNASGALVQRAGAIADFAESYSGQALYSGLITDELLDAAGGIRPADRRQLSTTSFDNYPYDLLSEARIQALRAVPSLKSYAPTPAWRIGELFAYEGFVETFFAENMCSGTPLGVVVNGTPAFGPTLTRGELLRRALADFDSAGVYAVAEDSIGVMATVGVARALLDSGDFPDAARIAATVPAGYQFQTQYASTAAQINQLFEQVVATIEVSVSDLEGENGLDFVSANDPRVQTVNLGPAIFGTPNIVAPVVDRSPTAPMVLASAVEARLIQAEAALPVHGGSGQAWLNILNALRTDGTQTAGVFNPGGGNVAGLAPLTDPGSDTARVSLLFRERAFWLFLTGHRQGDMRRLIRQYGRPTETVFPTGPYYLGGTYKSAVAFQPFGESFNPNFHGCVDNNP